VHHFDSTCDRACTMQELDCRWEGCGWPKEDEAHGGPVCGEGVESWWEMQ
jgi:hypothetical protein